MTSKNYLAEWYLLEQKKLAVWTSGYPILGLDPSIWREDFERRVMNYSDYGVQSSRYGWQFDHIVPLALGGTDDLSNLRPRHWFGNQSAGGRLGGLLG